MGMFRIAVLIGIAIAAMATPGEVNGEPVTGVYGLESLGDPSWLAVKVAVPPDSALVGVMWYNNDATATFPRLLVGTGFEESPGDLQTFTEVAVTVTGPSSDWSEVTFDMPIGASLGSLYVAFELPGAEYLTSRGMGGGAGIGYFSGTNGARGWLSGDGQIWASLHEDYSFAVLPRFVFRASGMMVKSLDQDQIEYTQPATEVGWYLGANPTPFNPRTELQFGLTTEQKVSLEIYDVRGRQVATLVNCVLPRGHHQVTWEGFDTSGRSVASGVYVARLQCEERVLTRQMVLLR